MHGLTGDVPDHCAWWAFHLPDVQEVLRAHDFWDAGLSEWWGEDPPWWLVLGVAHYHRVWQRVEVDTLKQTTPKPPAPPAGSIRIRG